MVEVTSHSLSSTWKKTSSAKWKGSSGTWKVNNYQYEFIISVTEDISFSVTKSSNVGITKADHVHLDDSCLSNTVHVIHIDENIGLSDFPTRGFHRTFNTAFNIASTLSYQYGNNILLDINEKLHLEEKDNKELFNFSCRENIGIDDSVRSTIELSKTEQLAISDSGYISKLLMLYEKLELVDYMSTHNILFMDFHESLFIADSKYNTTGKEFSETFGIDDALMRNSNAVISDIIISANEIVSDVPIGYGEWLPFVSGDYTYDEALIKCVITLLSPEYSVLLTNYKICVDLPDIQDHAVTTIPAEKYYIPFSLEFYRVPEVTITTIGSSDVAIPHIVEVTLEGFYVELRNLSNELVSGKISWQALGC